MDILDGLAGLRDEAVLEQDVLLLGPPRSAVGGSDFDRDNEAKAPLESDGGDKSGEGTNGSQIGEHGISDSMEPNSDPLDTPLLAPWQSKGTSSADTNSGDEVLHSAFQLKGATIPAWDPGLSSKPFSLMYRISRSGFSANSELTPISYYCRIGRKISSQVLWRQVRCADVCGDDACTWRGLCCRYSGAHANCVV